MPINREWLEGRMAELGITAHALKTKFHFSPDTFNVWDQKNPPMIRPDTIRRLAEILQVSYIELIRKLRITPGDFSEVGQFLVEARQKKTRRRVKS